MAEVLAVLGALLALVILFPAVVSAWWKLAPAAVGHARLRLRRTPWSCFWLGCLVTVLSLCPVAALLALPLEPARIAGCTLLFIVLAFAGLGVAGLAANLGERLMSRTDVDVSSAAEPVGDSREFGLAAGIWLGGVTAVVLLPALVVLLHLSFNLAWPLGCSLFAFGLVVAFLGRTGVAAIRGPQSGPDAGTASTASAFLRGTAAVEMAVCLPVLGWFVIAPIVFTASLGAAVFALLRWQPGTASSAQHGAVAVRRIVAVAVGLLWVLLFVAISVAVVAFFLRGGVPLELVASFPAIGWLVLISFYVVTALAAIVRWLWRRAPGTAVPGQTGRLGGRVLIPAILVWLLPFLAISLSATAFHEGGPTRAIPNGLLYSLVPECEKYTRYRPVDYSMPIAHVPVPQHPYMAPNPGNNMHGDAYISDTYEASGPLGLNPEVSSRTQGFGGYGTITFDSAGRVVGVYGDARRFQLELLDPYTLEELASFDLPPRPWDFFFSGVLPWEYIGAGVYFYLDNQDRAVVPTTENDIWVVSVPDDVGGFELVREYALAEHVVPGQEDSVAFVLPDWGGEYYWYATTAGIVGTVCMESGAVRTLRLEGERIENSFAVGEDGVYIISDRALYRFSHDGNGGIIVDWRTGYDRGTQAKPGHITRGSGTSVTLMGDPEDGQVAVTDNAEPSINLLFVRRSDGDVVCGLPLFEEGKSGTDLTVIGFEHADERGVGTGVYSVIVENNWGHHSFPLSRPEPGLTRLDCTRRDDGNHSCEKVWESAERSIGGFRLSFGNGLVYTYGKVGSSALTEERWYLTALDFATGETVYRRLMGTGLGYNNWAGSLFLHPDGMAYSTTIFGLVMIRDSVPEM